MQIEKYKKLSNGRYKVYFTNQEELTIYEDVILKYNLLTNKNINLETLNQISKSNEFYNAYNLSLNYISYKLRTEEEVKKYLNKKYEQNIIQNVIEKLKEEGYLSKEIYINAYINDKINLSNEGYYKIKSSLEKLGFEEEIINLYLDKIPKEVWKEKIKKIVDKKIQLNKKLSNYMLKAKILNDLFYLGYQKNEVEEFLNFDNNEEEIIKKELEKTFKKYQNKCKTEEELVFKVKNEMYKKGFLRESYEEYL